MRCNNCGYDNEPGVSVCIKCGRMLQAGSQEGNPYQQGVSQPTRSTEPQPRPTVVGAAYANEPQPRPTVVGAAYTNEPQPRPTVVNAGAHNQSNTVKDDNQKICPKCSYPVLGGFSTCPQCGSPLGSASHKSAAQEFNDLDIKTTCEKCGKEVLVTYSFCPYCKEPIRQKTVYVRHHNIAPQKPKCSLTIIPDEGEDIEARKNCYEGNQVMLKRENTEPENRSITSKNQAELVFEEGKWFVQNHSELCSTAVEACRKIEILPGDVIVLGDRRFKFEVE